jgi:type IV pilus assembly protein PilY1
MNRNNLFATLFAIAVLAAPLAAQAQTNINEDFTSSSTQNPWWFFNGACLTASSATGVEPTPSGGGGTGGRIPGCTTIATSYYNKSSGEVLVGGQTLSNTTPDPAGSPPTVPGQGALRFTNGSPYGYSENGGIVSTTPFPTGQGVSITFKTVTYRGNSGGAGTDGADGISFFLMDASQLNTASITGTSSGNGNGLGSWGGSLGYSCSNANPPYNGLIGGYLGVGIDEYGNFLNGASNTLGESGTSASGDNTATGGGYQPGRIGLRGAGNVAWATLTGAYNSNPNNSAKPYYPATLAQSCVTNGGTYNANTGACESCTTGASYGYNSSTNQCEQCANGATYNAAFNTCESCPNGQTYDLNTNTCQSCASGSYDASGNNCTSCPAGQYYDSTNNECNSCPNGQTYDTTTQTCQSCASGSYVSGTNTCSSCPNGQTWNSSTNQCESCSSGSYDASNNTCSSCSSGTWDANTGQCESCTGGTWSNSGGAGSCTGAGSCSTGNWNGTNSACETCSSGTYDATLNAGGECYSCASGNYQMGYGVCCATNYNYNSATGLCTKASGATKNPTAATTSATKAGTAYTPTASSGAAPVSASGAAPIQNQPTTGSPNAPIANSPQSPTASTPGSAYPDSYYAVQNTCRTGNLWNYSSVLSPTSAGAASLTNAYNIGNPTASPVVPPILDYGALPGGYVVLPAGTQIANEAAMTRSAASPIFYQLKISQNGLLSLSYSICPPTGGCGAYQSIIKSANITTSNGPLPANFLFGFAGSTGGSTNIHEILCFKAAPSTSAASSAGASEKQSAKLETGTQAYFAYFNPANGWTGRVTASSLEFDQFGNVIIANTPNWDASCVLTGVSATSTCSTTGQTGPIVAENPYTTGNAPNRQILTWNGTTGVGFEYSNLTAAQQATIDSGDLTTWVCNVVNGTTTNYTTADRVNFLRGDRTCEINPAGVGEWRRRSGVLADIMDSSPVWVGSPSAPYTQTWNDRLNGSDPLPENVSGVQSYPTFAGNNSSRTQMVYVGANDGMVHGFRSGTFNSALSSCSNPAAGTGPASTCWTSNDGLELLAYVPGAVLNTIHSATANLDYSNAQYGHAYFVNAPPGAGDVFFNQAWHTWLVGGLGAGGASIYALDITNPGTTTVGSGTTAGNFAETHASTLVVGEWTNATITCVGNATCGKSMGNTYGIPQMRRLHDGRWAMLFGNGYGSTNGDAGIFVGVLDPTSGKPTFYYISAGASTGPNNGIAYVTPVDLDGDHITDYVYAGDLKGNVWRFDLTSATETSWVVTPGPVFTAPAGQPITTAIVAASGAPSAGMQQQLMLLFGTGQKTGLTNLAGNTYATAQQSLYGVWDWNMSAWNSLSTAKYASLPAGTAGTLGQSNLAQQVVNVAAASAGGDVEIQNNASICWSGSTGCTGGSAQYGWYLNLPSTQEQVIYSPELVAQALTVNTIVPAQTSPTSCATGTDLGYTYVLSALTGAAFNQVFLPPGEAQNGAVNTNPSYLDAHAIAMLTDATGSSFVTSNTSGYSYLVYETNQTEGGAGSNSSNIQGGSLGLNLPPNTTGHRLSWIELR